MDTSPVVTILPGVPGMQSLLVDGQHVPYPESTVDFTKVLAEMGFDVRFTEPRGERRYVGHKAWEVWLPILVVTSEVLMSIGSGILVEILKSYLLGETVELENPIDERPSVEHQAPAVISNAPSPYLHIDWRVEISGGVEERFVASGDADAVLESLGHFERHVQNL